MKLRRILMSLAIASLLAGCAADSDRWSDGLAVMPAAPEASVAAAPPNGPWGATVVPVTLGGPQAVADSDGPYLLDTGDKLRVFVYGQPNLSRIYTVDHAGRISVPLIGEVSARGLTTVGLERLIRRELGSKYVKDPHVTVDVSQNRPFFILGEVRTPGQYPYVSGMTIKTAAAIAGGFSDRADERKVQITRRINGLVERMDVPDDYVVQPGDTVYVYERFF